MLSGMKFLYDQGKNNIVYDMADIIANGKMKLDRMPFGLIDYNIRFFAAEFSVKLTMEDHYASWQETMLAHFGHRWVALNRGPMWAYETDTQQDNHPCNILAEAMLSGIEDNQVTENVSGMENVGIHVVECEASGGRDSVRDDLIIGGSNEVAVGNCVGHVESRLSEEEDVQFVVEESEEVMVEESREIAIEESCEFLNGQEEVGLQSFAKYLDTL